MNTIYTGCFAGDAGYLQYRFHDYDGQFADNTGGYVLCVKQTKCRRTNGNVYNDTLEGRGAAQYIIASYGKNPNNDMTGLSTGNLLLDANESGSVTAPGNNEGYLWMKIKNDPMIIKKVLVSIRFSFLQRLKEVVFIEACSSHFLKDLREKLKVQQ